MRKTYIHEILALSLLAVAACHQERIPGEEELGEIIRIEAAGSDAVTRAMLGRAELKKAGTTVKVYDQLTGFTGSIDGTPYEDADVLYIDDAVVLATDGSDDWNFASGHNWRWTRTGTHHFYGWLTHDGNGSGMNIPSGWASFNEGSKTLSVGPLTLDTTSPQFDFSYSDIVAVDVEANDFAPNGTIELPLKHLFSAMALTIENLSDDIIHLKDVSLTGFYNRRSASISFPTDGSGTESVTEISGAAGADFLTKTYQETLNKYDKIDLYTGQASTGKNFILMWPQKPADLTGAAITVTYTADGVYEEDGTTLKELQKTLYLGGPNASTNYLRDGLLAGKKYSMNLQFIGKVILLTINVLPWDYNEYSWDYSDAVITTNDQYGELDFDTDYQFNRDYPGYDRSNRRIILQDRGDVLFGQFKIVTPKQGSWSVTGYGSGVDYFTISPTEGSFDRGENSVSTVTFTITPSQTAVPASTVELHFNIAIELNGEWVDANSEFNRRDWRIIWERN